MIDICANSGWLLSSITCMHLLQMVMQVSLPLTRVSLLFYVDCILTFEKQGIQLKILFSGRYHFLYMFSIWNQCFSQGLWFDEGAAFWMLPCMNTELASALRKSGIFNVQQLLDLTKSGLQAVSGSFPASRLYQVQWTPLDSVFRERQVFHVTHFLIHLSYLSFQDLQNFPRIKMKLKLQKKDDSKRSPSLNIKLEKTNYRQNKSRAFLPRFPKVLAF